MEAQFEALTARVKLSMPVARKAAEVYRLAQSAQVSLTTPCLLAVCLAVAARAVPGETFSVAQQEECARQAGVPAVVYQRALADVQGMLNLAPKYTLRELAVRFGCAELVPAASALLARAVAQLPVNQRDFFDATRPVYSAAALEVVAGVRPAAAPQPRAAKKSRGSANVAADDAGADDVVTGVLGDGDGDGDKSEAPPTAAKSAKSAPRRIAVSVADMVKTCGCLMKEFRSAVTLLEKSAATVDTTPAAATPADKSKPTAPTASARLSAVPVVKKKKDPPSASAATLLSKSTLRSPSHSPVPSPPPSPLPTPPTTRSLRRPPTTPSAAAAATSKSAAAQGASDNARFDEPPAPKKARLAANLEPYETWHQRILVEIEAALLLR